MTDRPLVDQDSRAPSRKVTAGAIGGAGIGLPLAGVVGWIWSVAYPDSPMPPGVEAMIGSVLSTAAGFVVAYMTSDRAAPSGPDNETVRATAAELLRRLDAREREEQHRQRSRSA